MTNEIKNKNCYKIWYEVWMPKYVFSLSTVMCLLWNKGTAFYANTLRANYFFRHVWDFKNELFTSKVGLTCWDQMNHMIWLVYYLIFAFFVVFLFKFSRASIFQNGLSTGLAIIISYFWLLYYLLVCSSWCLQWETGIKVLFCVKQSQIRMQVFTTQSNLKMESRFIRNTLCVCYYWTIYTARLCFSLV